MSKQLVFVYPLSTFQGDCIMTKDNYQAGCKTVAYQRQFVLQEHGNNHHIIIQLQSCICMYCMFRIKNSYTEHLTSVKAIAMNIK